MKRLAVIMVSCLSTASLAADWPTSACNPQRTYRTEEDIRDPFELAWVRYFPDAYVPHRVEPIIAGGVVYVASSKGVYAFDAATGQEKWLFATLLPVGHAPSVAGGLVFVPGLDKRLYAVDAQTGKQKWAFEAGAGFLSNPLVVEDTVYIGSILFGSRFAEAADESWRAGADGELGKLWGLMANGRVADDTPEHATRSSERRGVPVGTAVRRLARRVF